MAEKNLLRGVVVTNHGRPEEKVVWAMESNPGYAYKVSGEYPDFNFDFERKLVYPLWKKDGPGGMDEANSGRDQIPAEELKKFDADFGLYFSS